MKTFRTYVLAVEFYKRVEELKLSGHLRDQLLRAASSIALNLAEGNAKTSVKEKKRFYQIAYGSLKECQAIFEISRIDHPEIIDSASHLGASLYRLNHSKISVTEKVGAGFGS